MPWVTFTAEDIRDGLAVREVSIYEEVAALGFDGVAEEGSGDRIDRIAERTVDQFRGIISANPQVTSLGPVGTIPAFCVPWAIAIARVSMFGLNPVEEGRTDSRRDEYNDATKGRDSLKSMNAAALAIDEPTTPTATGAASSGFYGGVPLVDF